MKQNKTYLLLTSTVVGIGIFSSCAKDPLKNMTNEESRIYITNYDSTVNFNEFKTYNMSDSIAVVSDGDLQKRTLTETDAAFIQAVKNNMQERGYQLINKDEHPDLGVNISNIINNRTSVISYPSYWGYYNNYYDPYYWSYSGYDYYFPYSSYAVYQITEGALSIDMFDLKNVGTNKKIEGVWNGLIRGEAIFTASTAASQVKALFDQSSYLKTNL